MEINRKHKKPSPGAIEAQNALRDAVHKELVKKAKLGHDAIIWRDGKACRLSARELLNEIRDPLDTKDELIISNGIQALQSSLGPVDTARFLHLIRIDADFTSQAIAEAATIYKQRRPR